MRTLLGTIALIALVAAGCGDDSGSQPEPAGGTEPAPVEEPDAGAGEEDPYEVYLRNAPPDAPELTRDDAQTRALLGCEETWAPGTVDAVLQDAYKDFLDC